MSEGERHNINYLILYSGCIYKAYLFVLVRRAPYTTEKQVPMENSCSAQMALVGLTTSRNVTR